jgi:hypothetical protein
MARKSSIVLLVVVAVALLTPILFGYSTSGVELNAPPVVSPNGLFQPSEPPGCVSVHTYSSRFWPGLQMLRSDVWLRGCNDSAGHLSLVSGPTCQATSFLGRGKASCTATQAGDSLRVVVQMNYPFGLNEWAGQPTRTTFMIDPGGGYSELSSCLNNQGC